jgi:hypothetical protein
MPRRPTIRIDVLLKNCLTAPGVMAARILLN